MRVAHINVTATLSTGRVAVGIVHALAENGHKGLVAFSRGYPPGEVPWIRIGSRWNILYHAFISRITDRAGFMSRFATRRLVRQLLAYSPDMVHLHNLHGYYLHLPTLFRYLFAANLPVVWTLHDCWPYTGHCAHYTATTRKNHRRPVGSRTARGCYRWKSGCGHCPLKHAYPKSLLLDQSARNWREKRSLIRSLNNLTLVAPSRWLQKEVQQSFLQDYSLRVFPSGIDLSIFKRCENENFIAFMTSKHYIGKRLGQRKMLLGVGSAWKGNKGLSDFIQLASIVDSSRYFIVLVGLTSWQLERLPESILGIGRIDSVPELCALYTIASLYITLSHEETMGFTLLEAMACGTQVLCYQTTALPELITDKVGSFVPAGDLNAVAAEVERLCGSPKSATDCRSHAEGYDKRSRFQEYIKLYEELLSPSSAKEKNQAITR